MDSVDLSSARWTKSTRSGGNGQCIECADLGALVAVRDSKDPHGPVLTFTREAWQAFVEETKKR